MRTLNEWLSVYAESHQNPTNKKIHHVCVPLIMLSILALLWVVPNPDMLSALPFRIFHLIIALCLAFYATLGLKVALRMTAVVCAMLVPIWFLERTGHLVWSATAVFVLAWIGQFIGHKIEGKKPSFLQDLAFLLIGPVWVLIDIGLLARPEKNH
jgi:uncharacterized membrane protein YGL010W